MLSYEYAVFISLLAFFIQLASSSIPQPHANNLVLVKIGGSCVTNKKAFEELNGENLEKFCLELAAASSNISRHVVVHGAGSFGHFSARRYELVKGGRDEDWRRGFCETRASVLKLNTLIIGALIKYKLAATTVTLFPSALTRRRVLDVEGPLTMCDLIIENGMIPVIHGDAILDVDHRCTIFRL